jgi:hypothetical protein
MLITKVSRDGTERTWQQPAERRVAAAVCMAVFPALPGLLLGLALTNSRVPNGGWIALEVAVPAWGILAWRTLAFSVTMTPDTLVIRNIFTTKRVPLADITGAGFRRGRLTLTAAYGAAPAKRFTVGAVNLGSTRWSGLRGDADRAAEAISAAAGLPPLPPRREIISRNWAWVVLVAAALCFGFGSYYGPLQSGNTGLPLVLRAAGGVLYGLGIGMLTQAFLIIRDHRRKRDR